MACGKPVFASNIRGNVDLIDQGKGGELFDPNDSVMLSKLFDNVLPNSSLLSQYGIYNKKKR
ncbi:glycosyltransferase [Tetragenococcus halophilus]|nr:glycosyltransferase [Tetragenococcus halophilus]